jgi:hypothetical protein
MGRVPRSPSLRRLCAKFQLRARVPTTASRSCSCVLPNRHARSSLGQIVAPLLHLQDLLAKSSCPILGLQNPPSPCRFTFAPRACPLKSSSHCHHVLKVQRLLVEGSQSVFQESRILVADYHRLQPRLCLWWLVTCRLQFRPC